jgi:hypothetical protein
VNLRDPEINRLDVASFTSSGCHVALCKAHATCVGMQAIIGGLTAGSGDAGCRFPVVTSAIEIFVHSI